MNKNYFVIHLLFRRRKFNILDLYENVRREYKNRDNEQCHITSRGSRRERELRHCGKLSSPSRCARRDKGQSSCFHHVLPSLARVKISRFPRIIVNPGVSPGHIPLKNRRHSSYIGRDSAKIGTSLDKVGTSPPILLCHPSPADSVLRFKAVQNEREAVSLKRAGNCRK